MTARTRPPVQLSDAGDVLAAVPHLLGFTPAESLVVIALGAEPGGPTGVGLTVRADLPPPEAGDDLLRQVLPPLRVNGATAVYVAVIAAAGGGVPPHAELVDTVRRGVQAAGISVAHAVWTGAIAVGGRWLCYDDPGCHGTLTDPGSSVLAATSAALGMVTYASREELTAQLTPVAEETMRRRAILLDDAVLAPPSTRDGLDLLRAAIRDARAGVLPGTDEAIVALAVALGDHNARDACLGCVDGENAAAAERLWTVLTQQTPAPERAEAAALLAFFAYRRGNGALAGIALDTAQRAAPGHRLSELLRLVLERGVHPGALVGIARSAAASAEEIAMAGTGAS